MTSKVILISLLVLILGFLIYLTLQLRKGKAIVLVFGTLRLADITPELKTTPIPLAYDISKRANQVVNSVTGITDSALKAITG